MEEKTKVCTKCGKEKNILEFNKSTHHSDGIHPVCKHCYKKINRMQRAAKKYQLFNFKIYKYIPEYKKCSKCGIKKKLNQFYFKKYGRFSTASTCKKCDLEEKRNYLENNREKVYENNRKCYHNKIDQYRKRAWERKEKRKAKNPKEYKAKQNARQQKYRNNNRNYVNKLSIIAYKKNPENHLQSVKNWRRKFPEKAKKINRRKREHLYDSYIDSILIRSGFTKNEITDLHRLIKKRNIIAHRIYKQLNNNEL